MTDLKEYIGKSLKVTITDPKNSNFKVGDVIEGTYLGNYFRPRTNSNFLLDGVFFAWRFKGQNPEVINVVDLNAVGHSKFEKSRFNKEFSDDLKRKVKQTKDSIEFVLPEDNLTTQQCLQALQNPDTYIRIGSEGFSPNTIIYVTKLGDYYYFTTDKKYFKTHFLTESEMLQYLDVKTKESYLVKAAISKEHVLRFKRFAFKDKNASAQVLTKVLDQVSSRQASEGKYLKAILNPK